MSDILSELYDTLQERKRADAKDSYVASLYRDGLDKILKKVGEEATETVIAAKSGDRAALVHELADLWFHTMIALAHYGLAPADVIGELERREGTSGIEEKALRKAQQREGAGE